MVSKPTGTAEKAKVATRRTKIREVSYWLRLWGGDSRVTARDGSKKTKHMKPHVKLNIRINAFLTEKNFPQPTGTFSS